MLYVNFKHHYTQLHFWSLTIIFREVVDQMRVHDFLLQYIYLVEEQDDWGLFEPLVGYDCPEQGHAFLHPILWKNTWHKHLSMSINMKLDSDYLREHNWSHQVNKPGWEAHFVTKELPLQVSRAHCHKGGSRWGLSLCPERKREREKKREKPDVCWTV